MLELPAQRDQIQLARALRAVRQCRRTVQSKEVLDPLLFCEGWIVTSMKKMAGKVAIAYDRRPKNGSAKCLGKTQTPMSR